MQRQGKNDRYQKHPLPDDFPISTLGAYREKIVAPDGPFEPQGDWTQVFGIHSTGTGTSRVGTLSLKRRARPSGVSLTVRHEKLLTGSTGGRVGGALGSRRILDAVLNLDAGKSPLSTPGQWSFRTRVLDEAGRAIPDAGLSRRAAVENGKLRVTTGEDRTRTCPLDGPYTVNWALFDAVGRLPRGRFEPIRFTLVDHFDQIKPGQTLVFRRALDASLAGRTVRLYGFDQTGRGVMPWTYWVDEKGRVVVALSGLETYMLESASS